MDTAKNVYAKKAEISACVFQIGWLYLSKQFDDVVFHCKKCCRIAKEIGDKEAEMNSYKMLALSCDALNRYDDAILYSRMCLDIVLVNNEEIDVKDAEMCSYLVLGSSHKSIKKYDEAIIYATVCLDIANESGDKYAEMKACMILGAAYESLQQCEEAILYEKKAIEVATQTNEQYVEMIAHLILGKAYLNLHKHEDAIFHSKEGIAIAKENGDKDTEIKACLTIGWVHFDLCQYDDAIRHGMACMDIAKEAGDKCFEIRPCLLLARAYYMLDQLNDAVAYGKRCLGIAEESNFKDAEIQAYLILGNVYLSLSQRNDVVMCANKCLRIARETDNKAAEIDALYILGLAYFSLDQSDVALRYLNKSNAIALEAGAKTSEVLNSLVIKAVHSYQNMYNNGLSYLNELQKNSEELKNDCLEEELYVNIPVEEYFSSDDTEDLYNMNIGKQMLQSIFGKIDYDNAETIEKIMECCTVITQAQYCIARGDYTQAMNYLEKYKVHELVCFRNLDMQITCLNAVMYTSVKRYDKALQSYQTLLSMSSKNSMKRLEVRCHFRIGSIYQILGQINEAEASYRQAIRCWEVLFDRLHKHDVLKISFLDCHIKCYKILSDILIQTNRSEEAFLVSERCRARTLKDILVVNYGMKRDVTEEEHIQLSDILSLVATNKYTILFYSVCFKKLYTFMVGLENGLQSSCQAFEDCEMIDKAFKEMNVRQAVERENRSLDATEGILVDDQNINCEEDGLTTRERNVYDEPWRETDESSLRNTLRELHQKLLKKVMGLIRQDEIVIITDGPLSKVPFAALLDPNTGRYLSETKRIRFAPSITTLKFLQECPADCYYKTGALIIGDPLVGRVMLTDMEQFIGPLKNARKEAEELAKVLGVKHLVGEEATKPVVMERLKLGASIVHIAAHGILSQSAIVLAPSPETRKTKILPDEEDYMLTMADVQKAQVRAQLVVLSCCHSGRGKIRAEGVVGMCRAFLASGARAVVASLWAIEDSATLAFMTSFYNHMKEGKSASESLQMTMNDMRNTEEYNKPMYWAPFFLMGDDVTIDITPQL